MKSLQEKPLSGRYAELIYFGVPYFAVVFRLAASQNLTKAYFSKV